MPTYRYRAMDRYKRSLAGRIWALDDVHARRLLEQQGMEKIFLKPPPVWEVWAERWQRPPANEASILCRQLGIMLRAGIPLISCLDVLLRQPLSPVLYRGYHGVSQMVQKGSSLSKAMRKHRAAFGDLYIGLVQVGETTGRLAENVQEVADHMEREAALANKVKAALTYPAVVTLLSLALAYFMVQHLLPRFINGLFADTQVELPWFTKVLVGITNFFQNPVMLGSACATLVIVGWLGIRYLRTPAGQIQFYEAAMKFGPTRALFGKVLAVRTARMLSTSVAAGMPMINALNLTSEACANPYLAHYLEVAVEDLRDGNPLSQCLRAIPFLPGSLCGFVEMGEESSGLSEVLLKAAQLLEMEIDGVIQTFTQLLEPVLVGAMGLMVGFVLIALFVPLYQVIGTI